MRQYYDGDGKQRDQYVGGPAGDARADALAELLKARIEETNRTIADIRILHRQGFQVADAKTYSTVASLHNHGIFRAGGVLVGSHAFGILLNAMGARAAQFMFAAHAGIRARWRANLGQAIAIALKVVQGDAGLDDDERIVSALRRCCRTPPSAA